MTRSALIGSEESARGGLLGRLTVSATDNWWVLLVTGIAWTIISIVIFRFDYSTVAAVGVLFGIIALASAANEMLVRDDRHGAAGGSCTTSLGRPVLRHRHRVVRPSRRHVSWH